MTLVTRLSLFFMAILTVVLVGFSTSLYWLVQRELGHQIDERVDLSLNAVGNTLETGPDGVEWEPGGRSSEFESEMDRNQVIWLVADDRGNVLARSKSPRFEAFLADVSPQLQLTSLTEDRTKWSGGSWKAGQQWVRADRRSHHVKPEQNTKLLEPAHAAVSITIGVSLIPARNALAKLAATLSAVSFMTWVLTLASCRWVCQKALLPVMQMAMAARVITAEDLSQRLPALATHDELADLNQAFNRLLDRVELAFEQQQRFTGDASHQLRTPLTVILGQIDVVLRRDRPPQEYREVLEKVRERARQLVGMTETLLFLARTDSEAARPQLEHVNLAEWLPLQLQTWKEHPRGDDMEMRPPGEGEVVTQAHAPLLSELLNILLDNACKYSDPGTPITIQLQHSEREIQISVVDRGIGIAEEELADLFVPFRRSQEARRRGIEGAGLGLSIARRLAKLFHGELSVKSEVGQGSCFTLQLSTTSP